MYLYVFIYIYIYQYTVTYCCSWPCPASGAKATGSSWGVSCLQYSTVSYPTHRAHGSCKTWTGLKGDVYIDHTCSCGLVTPSCWCNPPSNDQDEFKAVLMVELQALTFISTLLAEGFAPGPTQSDGSSTFFRSFTHFTSFTWSIAGGGLAG